MALRRLGVMGVGLVFAVVLGRSGVVGVATVVLVEEVMVVILEATGAVGVALVVELVEAAAAVARALICSLLALLFAVLSCISANLVWSGEFLLMVVMVVVKVSWKEGLSLELWWEV